MSLPSHVNTDKTKHHTPAMKEDVQHSGEVYYGMGPPVLKTGHSDSASSSGVYNQEKGHQGLPHYQQAAPVKWMQDSIQMPNWSQETPMPAWGQNFGPYMSSVNVRDQMAFHKGAHEGVAMPMGGDNQLPAPVESYRDATQAQTQGRGLEWEQHAAAAMHQAQLQVYQHGQVQPHVPPHTLQGPILQPFQASFRPNKQQFTPGYYSVFPGNKAMIYGEQSKPQQQLIPQLKQQQMHHQHQQQQQQQQHMHQQHHFQLQQQQHLQQQQLQQQQMQQQQLQIQQQYQQLQEQQQIQQIQQQMQQQNIPPQETTQSQAQPKPQQTQTFRVFQPPEPRPPDTRPQEEEVQSANPLLQPEAPTGNTSASPDQCPEKVVANPAESLNSAAPAAAPRRSRRLSKEGQSPLSPPSTNIWSQASKEPSPSQNGVAGAPSARGGESQVATGGVIQITRRRRRASKEINLETLAQKASEMESLPPKTIKTEEAPSSRQAPIGPLVIPVSVPVHKDRAESRGGWAAGRLPPSEQPAGQTDRKPVIVSRRRSIKNTLSFGQDEVNDPRLDEDGKSKFKRRTRPEPLVIAIPKPSTLIPPALYSSISSYQSNLRSPVRLQDNSHAFPPYTPPPILSPVRGGSGLYFSTFLTNIAVSNQILPPPATPKSATRSLLHSSSSEITPPVLPLIADATPVCLEPRINIGQQYQAEIPDLKDLLSSQFDQHKADLVWLPSDESNFKHRVRDGMGDLMNMACSSAFRGGGTNQELVLHCLHECGGNILETLERLMLQDSVFPKGHHLGDYHYSGSDSWTAEEKCYFNKGIGAYRKDFFLVQKLVRTKTVAQCVEFYYTYKKQVKVGRNGILTFGPPESLVEKHTDAVVDVKSSQQPQQTQGAVDEEPNKEGYYDESHESNQQARVAQSLQAHDYAGTVLVIKEQDAIKREFHHSAGPHRPRAEAAVKKGKAPAKPPQDPDAVFPCKKCNRVFYKVKSRSAHMKSHAEQEKKAAALRQKEEEEQAAAQARARKAAAAAALAAAHQRGNDNEATQQAEGSSQEDSSEKEDDDDEDWH